MQPWRTAREGTANRPVDEMTLHHIEDIGRLLLDARGDLASIRNELSSGAVSSGVGHNANASSRVTEGRLERTLERVERELREKAELVLNSVNQQAVSSLPSGVARAEVQGRGGSSRSRALETTYEVEQPSVSMPYVARSLSRRPPGTLGMNPSTQAAAARSEMRRKNDRIASARTVRDAGLRTAQRRRAHRLASAPEGVGGAHEGDGDAVVTEEELSRGMLSLLNRHRIPEGTDLTAAFDYGSPVVTLQRSRLAVHPSRTLLRIGARVDVRGARDEWTPARVTAVHGYDETATYDCAALPTRTRPGPYSTAQANWSRLDRSAVRIPKRISKLENSVGFSTATLKLDLRPEKEQAEHALAHSARVLHQSIVDTRRLAAIGMDPSSRPEAGGFDGSEASSGHLGASAGSDGGGAGRGHGHGSGSGSSSSYVEVEATTSQSLAKAVTKIRGFNDNMDSYALHQFIVRNGHVVTDTPDFISWKLTHAADWGAIVGMLALIEQWLRDFSIPIAFINGERLHALAVDELHRPSMEDLESCIANSKEVRPLLRMKGRRYLAGDGPSAAATVVQARFRCHVQRTAHEMEKRKAKTVRVLQRRWRSHADMNHLQRELDDRRALQMRKWTALQLRFRKEWASIKQQSRVVVHCPSHAVTRVQRLSIDRFDVRQNAQLGRLFDSLSDPNIDVIYIAAQQLPDEIMAYLKSQLLAAGITDPERRFRVVVPENVGRFPPQYLSLSTLLLLSPRALTRIRHLVHGSGRPGYLEAGIVGPEDRQLALELELPLLGPEPEHSSVEGTHSGARALFALAGARVPPGVHDVYTETQVLRTLSRVVAADPRQGRWLIVMNNEWGGRGHAWFDVSKLGKTIMKLRVQQMKLSKMLPGGNRAYFSRREPQVRGQELVESEIAKRGLSALVVIGNQEIYPSWKAFMKVFSEVGGSVEAGYDDDAGVAGRPTANCIIEPDGAVILVSTHDRICAKSDPYGCAGTITPQRCVAPAAIRDASMAIGRTLFERGVLGHFAVDYMAIVPVDASAELEHDLNPVGHGSRGSAGTPAEAGASMLRQSVGEGMRVELFACTLRLTRTRSAAMFSTFSALARGKFDERTGDFAMVPAMVGSGWDGGFNAGGRERMLAVSSRPRTAVILDHVEHPNISMLRAASLFDQCRIAKISFDLQRCRGSFFVLNASLASSAFSFLNYSPLLLSFFLPRRTYLTPPAIRVPPPFTLLSPTN